MSTVCSCLCLSWTGLRTSAFNLLRSVWRPNHSGSSCNYWQRLTIIALLLLQQDVQWSSCFYREAWHRMLIYWPFRRWRVHCCTTNASPMFLRNFTLTVALWQMGRKWPLVIYPVQAKRLALILYTFSTNSNYSVQISKTFCQTEVTERILDSWFLMIATASNNNSEDILPSRWHSHAVKTLALWLACVLFRSPSHRG